MENWLPIFWLVLAVVFTIAELMTVQLVSVWFALAAAVTTLVALSRVSFTAQLAVFVLVSCLALLFSRPLVRRVTSRRNVRTNADAVVGMHGIVTEAVDNIHECGRVTVNGLSWSARSAEEIAIPVDTPVVVRGIAGVKVFVTPLAPHQEPPVLPDGQATR